MLDRGLGIPISLSLVYWAVGERLGIALAGANLPHHFMLRFRGRRVGSGLSTHSDGGADLQPGNLRTETFGNSSTACSVDRFADRAVSTEGCGRPDASESRKRFMDGGRRSPCCFPYSGWPRSFDDDPGELRDLGLLYAQTRSPGRSHRSAPGLSRHGSRWPMTSGSSVALVEAIRHKIAQWN